MSNEDALAAAATLDLTTTTVSPGDIAYLTRSGVLDAYKCTGAMMDAVSLVWRNSCLCMLLVYPAVSRFVSQHIVTHTIHTYTHNIQLRCSSCEPSHTETRCCMWRG